MTARVVSRANGQTLTLTGTRSVYKASPVQANATLEVTAKDSPCAGEVAERYAYEHWGDTWVLRELSDGGERELIVPCLGLKLTLDDVYVGVLEG